ncbi:hypothetical protein [Infirmifilum sp.]|uniref:hypothetical protein n=1 Tax=Infirmifilum sp. TaxID=2856575 RepID=UPI003D14462E
MPVTVPLLNLVPFTAKKVSNDVYCSGKWCNTYVMLTGVAIEEVATATTTNNSRDTTSFFIT